MGKYAACFTIHVCSYNFFCAIVVLILLPKNCTWDWCTVGPNSKNPPKNKIKKYVKLTDHTCACSDLTNFECEVEATGNGIYVNFQKLAWKNSWNHFGWTYFWRVSVIWNHCVVWCVFFWWKKMSHLFCVPTYIPKKWDNIS